MKTVCFALLAAVVALAAAAPPSSQGQALRPPPYVAFGPFRPQDACGAGARPGEFCMERWDAIDPYGNQPFAPRRVRRQIGSSSAAAASSAAMGMGYGMMGYGMMPMGYGYPMYG